MSEFQERARRYHHVIREALLKEWDPIGVADILEAQDEYDGYVGDVYRLLLHRSPASKVFEYLWWLETEHMGLRGDRQRTLQFAKRLARLPEELG